MRLATMFLVVFAVGCNSAKNDESTTLRVSMPIETARQIIGQCAVEETVLAMETPPVSDGGIPLASIDLQVGENVAICIVYEDVSDGRVLSLSSCDQMDRPKVSRNWIELDAVNLPSR